MPPEVKVYSLNKASYNFTFLIRRKTSKDYDTAVGCCIIGMVSNETNEDVRMYT